MQTRTDQIIQQQIVMRHLKHYNGVIDGVWGPDCVMAKRNWEGQRDFAPAYPNGGLPFNPNEPAPKKCSFDRRTRMMTAQGLTPEIAATFKIVNTTADVLKAYTEQLVASESESDDDGDDDLVPDTVTPTETVVPTKVNTEVDTKVNTATLTETATVTPTEAKTETLTETSDSSSPQSGAAKQIPTPNKQPQQNHNQNRHKARH